MTAQKIGIEATTYVRNIYKYYVAYKLMKNAGRRRERPGSRWRRAPANRPFMFFQGLNLVFPVRRFW